MRHAGRIAILSIIPLFAACSGGGGSTPPAQNTAPTAAPVTPIPAPSTPNPASTETPLAAGSSIQTGGRVGTTIVAHHPADFWEYSEDPVVLFPTKINPYAFKITVSPAPLSGVSIIFPVQANVPAIAATNALELQFSKVPGVNYSINVVDQTKSSNTASFVVATNPVVPTPQPPSESKHGNPYYYGTLSHGTVFPNGIKLPNSGAIDPRALAVLVAQGIGFIRFGPVPTEVAANTTGPQSEQDFSFASTDPALITLHQNGITALYTIDAADAPAWGNPNTVGDARPIFETPALYAQYCSGVASHIASTLPWITRVEIGTDEPNFPVDWENNQAVADGMPQYADTTGYAYGLYTKACYAAVKSVAPNLAVVSPGVDIGADSYSFTTFLDHMYASGCRTGVCWDILSVHSFTWSDPKAVTSQSFIDNLDGRGGGPGSFYSYRTLQQEAVADGDTLPPIMITEMGFSSSGSSPLGVDKNVQALYTSEAFNQYMQDPTVVGVVYTTLVDSSGADDLFSAISTLDASMNKKPVWSVLNQFATN